MEEVNLRPPTNETQKLPHNNCEQLVVNRDIDYAKWCIIYKHCLMLESV